MNLHDLNICYETFEQEIEKNGYMACLYASAGSHNRYWTHEKKNPVWMAHYATETNYPGNYFMWQHSSAGRIDGINGDVDLDVFYPDKMKDWK